MAWHIYGLWPGLGGRQATEMEVKEVSGGSKVSSFVLAVDRSAEEWPPRKRCGEWLESFYQAT